MQSIPEGIEVQKEDETIIVKRDNDLRETKHCMDLLDP